MSLFYQMNIVNVKWNSLELVSLTFTLGYYAVFPLSLTLRVFPVSFLDIYPRVRRSIPISLSLRVLPESFFDNKTY